MAARTKQEAKQFYDRMSRVYDLLAEGSEGPVKDVAVHKLAPVSGERILEVGCGTGHVLVSLAAAVGAGGRVVGVDLSSGMLSMARKTLDHLGPAPPVALVCGNGMRLPLAAESFDALFMSFTLELFGPEEVPQVLAECTRVLKPGGRIAVASVSSEGPHGLAYEVYEWSHRRFPTLVDCRPLALAQAIEAAGFQIQDRMQTTMWVPVEIVVAVKANADQGIR